MSTSTNVLGTTLKQCSTSPTTGWRRDGYCHTDSYDQGVHTVCATMTLAFLQFTKSHGNDLSSARHPYFPGLKPGDNWCLCASRWEEARRHGVAPKVVLEATHSSTLNHGIDIQHLRQHANNPGKNHKEGLATDNMDALDTSNDVCPKK